MSDVKVYKRLLVGFIAIVLIVAAVAIGGRWFVKLTAPALCAFLFAWLLDPLVRFVNKKTGLGHKVCSIIVVVLFYVIVGGIAVFLVVSAVNELMSLASNLEAITDSVEAFASKTLAAIKLRTQNLPDSMSDQIVGAVKNLTAGINESYTGFISRLTKGLSGYALKLTNIVFFAAAFIAGSLMFSFKMPMYRAVLSQSTKSDPNHPVNLLKKILRAGLGGYLRASLILAAYVGILCTITFFIIGQDYAVLLGMLMSCADIIPNFGATVILLPWAFIALLKKNTTKAIILAVAAGVTEVTRNMIYPKVMGTQTGLSPLLTVISSFVGWKLWGVFGMIVGPILALIIVSIFGSGIFDGVISDLKVLYTDVHRRFSGSKGSPSQ